MKVDRIEIVGGGLAGCLLYAALKSQRSELPVYLWEQSSQIAGNHTWSFHDQDVPTHAWSWVRPLISQSWPCYDVAFPKYQRTFLSGYHSIRSHDLRQAIMSRWPTGVRCGRRPSAGDLEGLIVSATGWPTHYDRTRFGYQKFVGLNVELAEPHGLKGPILMDAQVPQLDGYRFFYVLPWTATTCLIEDTYYSNQPDIDEVVVSQRIREYISRCGWKVQKILDLEKGVLPLAMDISFQSGSTSKVNIGVASGALQPVTGYTVPYVLRQIQSLVQNLDPQDLAYELRRQRQSMTYLIFLNRMLFRAAQPERRYLVLQRFYELSEGLIGRFYSGQLTLWDRFRILCGRPPVPILEALKCLRAPN